MSEFTIHTIETAPKKSKKVLESVYKENQGYIPNLIGLLANAPASLEAYRKVGAINRKTSLSPLEREVVQITAARRNGCDFCVAGHSAFSVKQLNIDPELLKALKDQSPIVSDRKLDALANFTRALIQERGKASDQDLAGFFAAGYDQQAALEVVLGVSLATLCNYANNLAHTPINPELQEYA
ncbi:carboxymuconolactone decarboxylase family protein [Aerococcus sp. UMB10185]|uniref:carboxymuconolactone decarboxylase family protein n=1 Tax=unclassified Aerococcus TaxID=2618060 RepID=UPI0008A143B3|nr:MULTISPECIES: carboxymuconolactone decarboxylase family protein [unclassified Aerococcus]KAB0646375.1 carboxymuconolactone decarboxylase family protein [Aerococcus sanguinicola]MDK6233699.1 carboxymuconolactone decarboxylase family protein [Aerococcus sp. UMB10185]MDK6855946.1 carboxymuconolactone decarboxylase family protein [Aerococcus sp. UMB7533]OFN03769.1 alkylhydroperoxidase [Aerococcus sp. HMSC062A02]OHO43635.1 alkylhydroperoxidase [Aerococcus sp. HMSC035B07]